MNLSADRLSGSFFLVLGLLLYFVIVPIYVEQVEGGNLAPNTFPNFLSNVIALGGLALLVKSTDWKTPHNRIIIRAAIFIVTMSAGVYTMTWFGFAIVAPILALAVMVLIGERRPFWLICGTVGTTIFIWLSVVQLLDRPLP